MPRFAFAIQYDGRSYCGFQAQAGQNSIQAEVEKALQIVLRQQVRIHGAGRTDSGVSALAQVIHFTVAEENLAVIERLEKFIYSVNAVLPRQISFIYGQAVSDDFHARFSCLGREYIYRFYNQNYRQALFEQRAFWVRSQLDLPLMQEAAQLLLGEKDFAAFTRAIYGKNQEKTIRRIDDIRIYQNSPLLEVFIAGSGFLHNMVRIISGTLLDVGKGKLTPTQVKLILDSKDRTLGAVTLPAYALCFRRALYRELIVPLDLIGKLPHE